MDYGETIRRKSRILIYTLFLCIILRAIVNGIFIDLKQILPFMVLGLITLAVLLLLVKKVRPVIMMYLLPIILSIFTIALMEFFPCTTNYLMFFLLIFLVVIYGDFRPIVFQCAVSAVAMIIFFFKYQDKLASTWTIDAMVICIVYIVSGCLVFVSLSRLNRESFEAVKKSGEDTRVQSGRATSLLNEIQGSLKILDSTSKKIEKSISSTSDISSHIKNSGENVAGRARNVADQTARIRTQVADSSDRIAQIADASAEMKSLSQENASNVHKGNELVAELSDKMTKLSETMSGVSSSVAELSDQVKNISGILVNVRDISDQTNLLSLNATIEAARAGEAGKGFAVVAEQIRHLSDDSAEFSDQIGDNITEVSTQMQTVVDALRGSISDVSDCVDNARTIASSFDEINTNTDRVLKSSTGIEESTNELKDVLDNTLTDVSDISESMLSTSQEMEDIASNIGQLDDNIGSITEGYSDILNITGSLTKAASQNG